MAGGRAGAAARRKARTNPFVVGAERPMTQWLAQVAPGWPVAGSNARRPRHQSLSPVGAVFSIHGTAGAARTDQAVA